MSSTDSSADPSGSYRKDKLDLWGVHFVVRLDEVLRLRAGRAQTVPAERYHLRTQDAEEGEPAFRLTIDVAAKSAEEARSAGTARYRDVRAAAGLPDDPVELLGVTTPLLRDEVEGMAREAQLLLDGGRLELAVVRAQTACEMWARLALEGALVYGIGEARDQAAFRQCRYSMSDRRTQDVLLAFTGERVTDEEWWPSYRAHLQRRNDIVHEGLIVSSEDARSSLAAVEQCMNWLTRLFMRHL